MSKTVTFTDATWAEITSLVLGTAPVVTPPTPTPIPDPVLPGVKIIELPWATTIGRQTAKITPGVTLAFKFTVPVGYKSDNNRAGSFSYSPTGGNDYFFREMMLSEKPGDFSGVGFSEVVVKALSGQNQDARSMFMVGVPYMRGVLVKRPDPSIPVLEAGKTYYFNVRQTDPTLTCNINYSLNNL